MASRASTSIPCPWPGPEPYGEERASYFLGRDDDVLQLLHLMDIHPLVMLTAQSGIGKSSLLQAGLVPALRTLRDQEEGFGPVLVIRSWQREFRESKDVKKDASSFSLIIDEIGKAIEALADKDYGNAYEKLKEDILKLKAVDKPKIDVGEANVSAAANALLYYVSRLRRATGKLVLIFDQVEELLGSTFGKPDLALEREVLGAIGTLFQEERKQGARTRFVLSLREDYLGRMKPLDRFVSGLDSRLYRIDPMPEAIVQSTVLEVAKRTKKVIINRREAQRLISWLTANERSTGSVDLLRLQAILISLFNRAKENRTKESDFIKIDKRVLDVFQGDRDPEALGQAALEMHVEDLFEEAKKTLPAIELGLVRREVVRMVPWLSAAGGFKRHVEREELILNAVRSDFEGLDFQASDAVLRHAVGLFLESRDPEVFGDLEDRKMRSEVEVVENEGENHNAEQGDSLGWRSGFAKEKQLSRNEAAGTLVRCAELGIKMLSRSVLKPSYSSGGLAYELVHDGFGAALKKWAELGKVDLADTLSAIVSSKGETFRWREIVPESPGEIRTLRNVTWLGCNLNRTTLRDVVFDRCTLNGTIFTECDFENCHFVDCELKGVIFIGGSWSDVSWKRCRGDSVLVGRVQWDEVRFDSCVFENATFNGVSLRSSVVYDDCSLMFSQLGKFDSLAGIHHATGVEFRSCDLYNALYEDLRRWPPDEGSITTGVKSDRSASGIPRKISEGAGS